MVRKRHSPSLRGQCTAIARSNAADAGHAGEPLAPLERVSHDTAGYSPVWPSTISRIRSR